MRDGVVRTTLALAALLFLAASAAFAQSFHTFVSGVGDDVNPCDRDEPCKTLQGAISKTAPGGQIDVLDPGGYGSVNITKSITINGGGNSASILASGSNGISINAGANDVVKLVNIQLQGLANTSPVGIRFNTGAQLIVDHVTIHGFKTGIETYGGRTLVSHSAITHNADVGVNVRGGSLVLESSTLTKNGVGAQALPSATLRLSNVAIHANGTPLGCGGGTMQSADNNTKGGNVGGTAAQCAPTPSSIAVF